MSWRAEAVKTSGIIRPLRIVEIVRAAGQGVGAHRNPDRMGQIRGGFHHDGNVRCPGDGETKPAGLHAEPGAVVKDLRVRKEPWRGRIAVEKRAPARGARQVIDSRVVVAGENS